MKKFVFGLFLLVSVTTYGQFKKGTRMIGSSVATGFFNGGNTEISYPSNSNLNYSSKNSSYGITLSPNYGWFISDKTVVGVLLNAGFNGFTTTDKTSANVRFRETNSTSFNFGAGAFVRNYFNTGSSFMPFGQASLNLGLASNSSDGFYFESGTTVSRVDFDRKSTGGFYTNANLTFGVTKMLNSFIGLDLYLGYNFSFNRLNYTENQAVDASNNGTIDETRKADTESRFTSHGAAVGVGLQIFLDPKK
jgi:hypothetical protein